MPPRRTRGAFFMLRPRRPRETRLPAAPAIGPDAPSSDAPSARAPAQDLGAAFVRGMAWTVGMRWGLRGIGLVSTLIVARLLLPADYGLLAMATLVLSVIQVFLDADAKTALLRTPDAAASVADTAWTITVLQSLGLALIFACIAPFAAQWFAEPRLTGVIWVLAATVVVDGLGSVGPLLARKNLDYSLEVRCLLVSRVANFVVTVGCAFWWRNYWALVAGAAAGSVVSTCVGYAAHPHRPRFDLTHARDIFGFSQWMLVSGIGTYAARRLDGFVVGRVGTAADLGLYNVAMELGQMPTAELGAPLSRALMPVLATMHGDPARMRGAVMKTTAAMNTLTLPAGIGLSLIAPVAVPVLLGPSWGNAVPYLTAFAAIGAVRYLTGPYFALFSVLGRSRMLAAMSWIECAVFAVFVAAFMSLGVLGIVYARIASTIVIVGTWLLVGHANGLRLSAFWKSIQRPLASSAAMAAAVLAMPVHALPPVLQLALQGIVGAVVYVAAAWLLWRWAGSPDGIESRLVARLPFAASAVRSEAP